MARPKRATTLRLNLVVTAETRKLLEKLQVDLNAATLEEVVRRSCTIYSRLLEMDAKGEKLYYKDETQVPYNFIRLEGLR